MKRFIAAIILIMLCSCFVACEDDASGTIVMPNASESYLGEDWTLETLTKHFQELGFTSFENVACEPNDDDYRDNIFALEICSGLFSENPWEAGDSFSANDTIKIYYNEAPLLTVESCPDLEIALFSDEIDYLDFAAEYDGRYIEIDAYVIEHTIYMSGSEHIINVAGGIDESENGAVGLLIRIGDRTLFPNIDKDVCEGDFVTVRGRIDLSQSEYFKMLYVECLYLR